MSKKTDNKPKLSLKDLDERVKSLEKEKPDYAYIKERLDTIDHSTCVQDKLLLAHVEKVECDMRELDNHITKGIAKRYESLERFFNMKYNVYMNRYYFAPMDHENFGDDIKHGWRETERKKVFESVQEREDADDRHAREQLVTFYKGIAYTVLSIFVGFAIGWFCK